MVAMEQSNNSYPNPQSADSNSAPQRLISALHLSFKPPAGSVARGSQTPLYTSKPSKTETATELLESGGYLRKVSAGNYGFLPLGLRLYQNLTRILRQDAEAAGFAEVHLSMLQPSELWDRSGRRKIFSGSLATTSLRTGEFVLNPTQEEAILALFDQIKTRTNLSPLRFFQISERLRDIPRPANGLVASQSFHLADFYSINENAANANNEFLKLQAMFRSYFQGLGLRLFETQRSMDLKSRSFACDLGGLSEESSFFTCNRCNLSVRYTDRSLTCPACAAPLQEGHGLEVGDIVQMDQDFAKTMKIAQKNGVSPVVVFGGIGVSRVMHALAATFRAGSELIFPAFIAPYSIWIIAKQDRIADAAVLADSVATLGHSVFVDDRDISMGKKFVDADVSGAPLLICLGDKNEGLLEYNDRLTKTKLILSAEQIITRLAQQ